MALKFHEFPGTCELLFGTISGVHKKPQSFGTEAWRGVRSWVRSAYPSRAQRWKFGSVPLKNAWKWKVAKMIAQTLSKLCAFVALKPCKMAVSEFVCFFPMFLTSWLSQMIFRTSKLGQDTSADALNFASQCEWYGFGACYKWTCSWHRNLLGQLNSKVQRCVIPRVSLRNSNPCLSHRNSQKPDLFFHVWEHSSHFELPWGKAQIPVQTKRAHVCVMSFRLHTRARDDMGAICNLKSDPFFWILVETVQCQSLPGSKPAVASFHVWNWSKNRRRRKNRLQVGWGIMNTCLSSCK